MSSLILNHKPYSISLYFNFLRNHRFTTIGPLLTSLKIPNEALSVKFDQVSKNLLNSASVIFRLDFFGKNDYSFVLRSIRLGCFHGSRFNLLILFKFWYLTKLLNCPTNWLALLYLLPSFTTSSINFDDCFIYS